MIPIIIALMFVPQSWAAWSALALYSIAAITDFLDGYLARTMNLESAFGRFLDPIADKIFIASMLVVLAGLDRLEGIWVIPAVIILVREFVIAGLREFLGPMNVQLPVSRLAKWKTTVQMFALGFLIMGDYGNPVLPYTLVYGHAGITLAAVLTVMTGWSYLTIGLAKIQELDNKP